MFVVVLVLELVLVGVIVLVVYDCYGGIWWLFDVWVKKGCFSVVFVDFIDFVVLVVGLVRKFVLVWVEMLLNLLLWIIDICYVVYVVYVVGVLVVVDNIFFLFVLQQLLVFGVDLVVYLIIKYINGYSDVVGGVVVVCMLELVEQIKWWGNCNGFIGGVFDSYFILCGLCMLGVCLCQYEENVVCVVEYLVCYGVVCKVYYFGFVEYFGYVLVGCQQQGFGVMFSFELEGELEEIVVFVDGLEYFLLVELFGGVESLIVYLVLMIYVLMVFEVCCIVGIVDILLCLLVGIEDGDDLLCDFDVVLCCVVVVGVFKCKVCV